MKVFRIWAAAGAVACVALICAGWVFLISPTRKAIAAARAQTAQMLSTNATLGGQNDGLRAQAEQLAQKSAVLQRVAQAVPSDPAIATLTRSLIQLAAATHVTWSKLTPSTPSADVSATAAVGGTENLLPSYQTIPVDVSVAGSYADVEEYVNGLETATRLFVVKTISMAPSGGAAGGAASAPGTPPAASDSLLVTIGADVFETQSGVTDPPPADLAALAATASPSTSSRTP